MEIIVGSTSDRKIKVVEKIFRNYFGEDFSIQGHAAASNVPETPYGKETFDGARNRALNCKKNYNADFFVGVESGLVERYGEMYEEAWACVLTKDNEYYGYSSGLKLPKYLLKMMKDLNKEHCDMMEIIEKEFGSINGDTWGTYSGGVLMREVSLEEAIRNAVVQIITSGNSLYNK